MHNTSEKGGESFTNVCGFDVADDCTDVYYWFYKSSKRKSVLKEYNEFCNEIYSEVIRDVSTRWLCLEKCMMAKNRIFSRKIFQMLGSNV